MCNSSAFSSRFERPEFIQHKIERDGDDHIDPGGNPFRNAKNLHLQCQQDTAHNKTAPVGNVGSDKLLAPGEFRIPENKAIVPEETIENTYHPAHDISNEIELWVNPNKQVIYSGRNQGVGSANKTELDKLNQGFFPVSFIYVFKSVQKLVHYTHL